MLSILLYADDVVVMSEDHEELQKMLGVVSMYGMNFDVKFNDEKNKVLVMNGENEDDSRSWMLGGKKIHRTRSYKYLGMMLDEKECERTKNERIGRAI